MLIPVTCINCKVRFNIEVDYEDYFYWKEGMSVQKSFPYLSADERELLISRVCGKCFDSLFPED